MKKTRNKKDRTPYSNKNNNNNNDTLKLLDDIAVMELGKSAQIAAKKIQKSIKKLERITKKFR